MVLAYEKPGQSEASVVLHCPSCGCTLNDGDEVSEVPSMYEQIGYSTSGSYLSSLDIWTDISEETYYTLEYHNCGCDCAWTDDDEVTDSLSESLQEAHTYVCGKCNREWATLNWARQCCA